MNRSLAALSFGVAGLLDRERLLHVIKTSLAEDANGALAVVFVEISRFRLLTDIFGAGAVRKLLSEAAERILRVCGDGNEIGMLADDCFAIVMRHTNLPEAHQLAQRTIASFDPDFMIGDFTFRLQACAGVVCGDRGCSDPADLIDHVAVALGQAREHGGGSIADYGLDMERDVALRHDLAKDLCSAISKDQVDFVYQPIVSSGSHDWIGCEALARWRHPRHGDVSPSVFIPIAEDLGLIQVLTERAIRQVCEEAVKWPRHMFVAVNVSPKVLTNDAIVRVVAEALAVTGLDPARLELEITEGLALQEAAETVASLAALGVRIALDDFGTGASNLAYLRSFSFQKIKIDRSFVVDCLDHRDAAAIVGSIIHLAQALGANVTAEGIETRAQAERLEDMGCTELQGFLFAKPLTAERVLDAFSAPSRQTHEMSGLNCNV